MTRGVEYGPSSNFGFLTPLDNNLVTQHEIVLSELYPNSTYFYRVISRDTNGKWVVSENNTFTTIADLQAPIISNVTANDATPHSAIIIWQTDEASNSEVEFGLDTNYGSTVVSAN